MLWQIVDSIHLAHERAKWRGLANTVMNFWSIKGGKFLTRKILRYGSKIRKVTFKLI
jgi:hypothetical protein